MCNILYLKSMRFCARIRSVSVLVVEVQSVKSKCIRRVLIRKITLLFIRKHREKKEKYIARHAESCVRRTTLCECVTHKATCHARIIAAPGKAWLVHWAHVVCQTHRLPFDTLSQLFQKTRFEWFSFIFQIRKSDLYYKNFFENINFYLNEIINHQE